MPIWSGWSAEPEWEIERASAPWGDAPSIYRHILNHLRDDEPGLSAGGDELPDEGKVRAGHRIAWAPGALDGAFGHHADPARSAAVADRILEALRALLHEATPQRAAALYSLLMAHGVLEYLDALLPGIVEARDLDVARLHRVARWLATSAPDREPVKAAIGMLGTVHGGENQDLLLTLGRHEEFTLYSTVAFRNLAPHDDRVLFALARQVRGWGRVHLIERLDGTTDDQVRAWMLREGYENSVLLDYTALICARTGGLVEALRLPHRPRTLPARPHDQELHRGGGRRGPGYGAGLAGAARCDHGSRGRHSRPP